ncbi:hypothetical protein H6K85_11865 [Staphylococcus epidermidis]|nr:hypothetical protein [Staphylococcus epidermidis]
MRKERMLAMAYYIVQKAGGQIIAEGNILSELIEFVYSNQINNIDQRYSTLTKIERNLYQYMNQLSSIYNVADDYAEAIKSAPCCLDTILEAYNQSRFIKSEEFIDIKVNKEAKLNG